MKRLLRLQILFVTWISIGLAQDASSLSTIELLPKCAQLCLGTAIAESHCQLTNTTCICTNTELQAAVEGCVVSSCTVRESLNTKNVTSAFCHAPIRSSTTHLRVSNITMCIVTVSCTLLRVIYRRFFTTSGLGWDDYTVAATVLVATPSVIIIDRCMLTNGLGLDIWTVPLDHVDDFVRWLYTLTLLYFIQTAMVKLTLLLFFLRIFVREKTLQLLWGTVAFIGLWTIAFFIPASFPCLPLSDYWTAWDKEKPTKCLNIYVVVWAHAIISIALDVWMLAIPLYEVFHLRMTWMKKFGVALMFCIGTFVTVVSILRFQLLINFEGTSNVTWDQTNVILWSVYEINVGAICACMPALRSILIRVFPIVVSKISGKAQRSRGNRYGSRSRGTNGSLQTIGSARSRKEIFVRKSTTIAYNEAFTVPQEQDEDEAELVHMEGSAEEGIRERDNS